jgi:hypothetical protein
MHSSDATVHSARYSANWYFSKILGWTVTYPTHPVALPTKTKQGHALSRHLKSISSRVVKKKLNYPDTSPSGGEDKLNK